jgi:hypothetical protein
MNQNQRRAAPAIDPTKNSSLFEVPGNVLDQFAMFHQTSFRLHAALSPR